jgi:glucose 1-dehydrogenase
MNDLHESQTQKSKITSLHSLCGQVAIVTGANSGIGKAIAIGLAQAGADIVINHIKQPVLADDVAHEVTRCGQRALVIKADVSKEDDVISMFQRAIRQFGTLHILVGNAGLQADAPFTETSLEQWNLVLNVNLMGQFLCMREASREFIRRGVVNQISASAGKILSVSSVHQRIPWAGHVNYAASKGGLMMLMRSVALELAPLRIRVNAIAPGAIRTPINMSSWSSPEALKRIKEIIPYGSIGEPEDVARAASWLVSDAADYVTGATLVVDGGLALTMGLSSEE